MLAKAFENGIQTTSLRVGQLCGSTGSGAWNTTDWVPILVRSGIAIGALPTLNRVRRSPESGVPYPLTFDSRG